MKLFYDHLIERTTLHKRIDKEAKIEEEKKKLLQTLDEMIHHAVLDVILVHLDEKNHEEFLTMLHKTPHSEELLVYIKEKGHPEIERKIKEEIERLTKSIFKELGG